MLNTKHFVLLAGDPEDWDREMLAAAQLSDFNLTNMQRDQHKMGRRSAQLHRTTRGWSVRLASSLSDNEILVPFQSNPQKAILSGVRWANEDPLHREFYVERSLFNKEKHILENFDQHYCL